MKEHINQKLLTQLAQDARKTKAYTKFLKVNNKPRSLLNTSTTFSDLPIMDKKNYFHSSKLSELYPNNRIPPYAYASSGSSGKPTFWFRNTYQDFIGAEIHEHIAKNVLSLTKKEPTLVIICFSMGIWVAGSYTASSFAQLNNRGYNLSVITPGIETEAILSIMKSVARDFKSIILCGYPPFLMDLVQLFEKEKLNFSNQKVHVFGAGDKITQEWKTSFKQKITNCHALPQSQIMSVYGSADATIMGFQTPISDKIECAIRANTPLAKELLGDLFTRIKDISIYQYDPKFTYFETVGNELVISARTASPLIRYNMHDIGKVIPFKDMATLLAKHKIPNAKKFSKLPFIILSGRSDVSTMIYALNIYPEHIVYGLEHEDVKNLVSGNFVIYTKKNKDHTKERLHVDIELAEGMMHDKTHHIKISQVLTSALLEHNMEYRKLYASMQEKALLEIKMHRFGAKKFAAIAPPNAVLNLKNKKPRVIL